MENTFNSQQYWVKYVPGCEQTIVKGIEILKSNCAYIQLLLFMLVINIKCVRTRLKTSLLVTKAEASFHYMASAKMKRHGMISALLICTQRKIHLRLFDLPFNYIYFRYRLLQQHIRFQLIAVWVTPNPSSNFGINVFWRWNLFSHYSCLIMGLTYVEFQCILCRRNIIWILSLIEQ